MTRSGRTVPLIVVASAGPGTADEVAERLRRTGAVAYPAHSSHGCVRVATSVGPDMVLVDPALSGRLEKLLRAHPRCAQTRILPLSDAALHEATARVQAAFARPAAA